MLMCLFGSNTFGRSCSDLGRLNGNSNLKDVVRYYIIVKMPPPPQKKK